MAEQAQAAADAVKDAVSNVADKVGELTTQDNAGAVEGKTYLDEVTGEHVSKSECTLHVALSPILWLLLTKGSEEAPEAASEGEGEGREGSHGSAAPKEKGSQR